MERDFISLRNKVLDTRNVIVDQKGDIAFSTRLYDEKEFNDMVNKIDELYRQRF